MSEDLLDVTIDFVAGIATEIMSHIGTDNS